MKRRIILSAMASALVFSLPAFADSHENSVSAETDVTLSGWARLDYGIGEDRYGADQGDDHFGVSKAALVTQASHGNTELTAVLGTTILSDEADGGSDDLAFKELFVTFSEVAGSQLTLVGGLQPILFGLKPEGYERERTIVPSLNHGGAGGFAVSTQDALAVRAIHPITEGVDIELAAFDTSETSGVSVDGSTIWSNGLAQVRVDLEGFYGAAGIEGVYVGATDDTEAIYSAGLGFGNDVFDISGEWISLAKEITGTVDDETYVVVEATVTPMEDLALILDWATADEADVDTIRAGVRYDINSNLEARVEYAGDLIDTPGAKDIDSVDARLTFTY